MSNESANKITDSLRWCSRKLAGAWQWYKGLYKGRPWYIKALSFVISVIVAFFLYLGAVDINFLWLFGKSPSMSTIKNKRPAEASIIYSADGKVMGKFFSENRTPVTFEEVNPVFWQALIDTEDERFYHHHGIDYTAFVAVLKEYILHRDARGASTITQQLAKNLFRTRSEYSTGLLGNRFAADFAFHTTGTDGYVHGTAGNSGSWYVALSWVGRDVVLRYRNIGNYEHTGQAWNGVTAGTGDLSIMDGTYGNNTGIKTYADMYAKGLGKFNSLYESLDTDTYGLSRYTLNDGSLWPKTTDNFWQDHNILSAAWNFAEGWNTTLSLHYTHGYGYYEEFRQANKLSKFGFASFKDTDGNTVKRTDFVRQKGLSQDAGGAVWNITYQGNGWDFIGGVSAQLFGANHFGYLTYVASPAVTAHYPVLAGLSDTNFDEGLYKYYDSDARKNDYSSFIKVSKNLGKHFNLFWDLQYRRVTYRTDGINDKFIEQPDGSYVNQVLDIDKTYDFLNPKAGVSWTSGSHRVYASFANSNREPERNNFTDNGSYPSPESENVSDFEFGYQFSGRKFRAGANLYYMDYVNQFVQTGAVSDIGEALTTNVWDSYRAGIELVASADISSWLTLEANAALSRNRIKDFDEVVEDWDNGSQTIHYDNSTLAFSPSAILNGFVILHPGRLQATWHTSYVSRQYLDNTENRDRSLPGYSLSGLSLRYPLKFKGLLKEVNLGLDVNNIFGVHAATSGWVYSAIYASGGHPEGNRYYQIGFVPTAGTTVMGSISLKFR